MYTFAKEHVIRASGLLSLLMPQTSGVGIGVKGLDGRYELSNLAMEALLGKTAQQIIGRTDADLFPANVAAQLQRSDLKITEGAAAASDELEFSVDGVPMQCLWLKFPVLGSDGGILLIGAVMLDIARQENYVEMRQSLEQLQQTNQELEKILLELDSLASTDQLTGAWNRRRLEEALVSEMDRCKRYSHPLSLLMIDIDGFKRLNEEHGEAVGDQVLTELAAVIQPSLRAADTLTRWGGDEFVVLCPNTPLATVTILAERLRERVSSVSFTGIKSMTVSLGVAECLAAESADQWLERADAALLLAKAGGRNQIQVAV